MTDNFIRITPFIHVPDIEKAVAFFEHIVRKSPVLHGASLRTSEPFATDLQGLVRAGSAPTDGRHAREVVRADAA